MSRVIRQGELYSAVLDPTRGSEQQGVRPVVVVSGNAFNQNNKICMIVPLTSKIKKYFGSIQLEPTPENGLNQPSEALGSHIRTVSAARLGEKIGSITTKQVKQLHYKIHCLLTVN